MCQLIESICIKNGQINNLIYHQKRMNNSLYALFGIEAEIDLEKIILYQKPPLEGKFKCRIIYDTEIESIEFMPYEVKSISSVRLVEDNEIEYSFKFRDRQVFENLLANVIEDEIIITKNGQITDTSYSNLVFFDGEKWVTPCSFLLNGTMRQCLLEQGKISEEEINPKDLNRFFSFKLINAMMDLDESPSLPIEIIS